MNLKNMRECDNSKIHISSNFLLSVCLLIMLDTLLLVPSLHCNSVIQLVVWMTTVLCIEEKIHLFGIIYTITWSKLIYIYIYIYICVCVCVCVYVYKLVNA
jgi:uncharacterized membrane protein